MDLLVQFFAGALFGALFDQFALYGHLEDGLLHIAGEAFVEVLQAGPSLFIAFDQGQEFFDFGNDAFLLGEGWERKYRISDLIAIQVFNYSPTYLTAKL